MKDIEFINYIQYWKNKQEISPSKNQLLETIQTTITDINNITHRQEENQIDYDYIKWSKIEIEPFFWGGSSWCNG